MNTLIIGAGAIGIAAGTALQAAGASVTFLARGETKTAMEQGGIHRTGLLGEAHSQPDQFSVTDSYDWLTHSPFDYIIIAVKTMANCLPAAGQPSGYSGPWRQVGAVPERLGQ